MTTQIETLEDLIRETYQDTENRAFFCLLDELAAHQFEIIQSLSGLDLTGYAHMGDSFFLRHVQVRHFDPATETSRGQTVIHTSDFLLLPEFFQSHDSLLYEFRKGKHMLLLEKTVGGRHFVYVVEIRIGRLKRICALSLWAKAIKKPIA